MKIILCLGLKRSGSTLQYNLVRRVLEGNRCSYVNLGYKSEEEISEINIKSFNTDYVLVKCHAYDLQAFDGNKKYTLFIHRDVRDMYISLREKWGVSSDAIDGFVVSCREACNYAKNNGFLVQRYEEIYYNHDTALDQIAKFLELESIYASDQDITDSDLLRSVFSKVFLSLKKIARARKHLPLPMFHSELQIKRFFYSRILKLSIDPRSQIHPDHRSKTGGEPGAWMTELTDEEQLKFVECLTDLRDE
jgi:hypothetical protein